MLTYRVYPIGWSAQNTGQASILSAEHDSEALAAAIAMTTPETGAEVWQGSRLVCRLPCRAIRRSAQRHRQAP